MFKNKIPYLNLIISIIITFIAIKVIDNFTVVLDIFLYAMSILSPFITAFIIAYILNPILKLFEKKLKLNRGLSVLSTYLVVIGVISILISFIVPNIISNATELVKDTPIYKEKFVDWARNNISSIEKNLGVNITNSIDTDVNSIISSLQHTISIFIKSTFNQVLSFTAALVNLVFGLIISIYVLYDKEKFIRGFKRLIFLMLKEKNGNYFIEFIGYIHFMIGSYLGIKSIDSMIIGLIAFIGLTLLKSPYAILLACFVACTNMIPYFGPFVGMIPATIINLFVSPINGVKVLIFLLLLQQFDGWYLDPKLIGGKVGLHPFLVILGVTVGGALFGVIGMLLATPTMAVLNIYYHRLLDKYAV